MPIRPMLPADLSQVQALAAIVPTAPHWPPFEYQRMLQAAHQNPTRRSAWVYTEQNTPEQPPDRTDKPPGHPQTIQAFALATHVAGIAELETLVTAPTHRRQGLGTTLLQAVAAWATTLGATQLQLEARASNTAALSLYARLGFLSQGTRSGYYRNPDEAAILLTLPLPPRAL